MNGPSDAGHELTQADCDRCKAILTQRAPLWAAKLERLKRAGFDLPEPATRNQTNAEGAAGILREYFPEQAHVVPHSLS